MGRDTSSFFLSMYLFCAMEICCVQAPAAFHVSQAMMDPPPPAPVSIDTPSSKLKMRFENRETVVWVLGYIPEMNSLPSANLSVDSFVVFLTRMYLGEKRN